MDKSKLLIIAIILVGAMFVFRGVPKQVALGGINYDCSQIAIASTYKTATTSTYVVVGKYYPTDWVFIRLSDIVTGEVDNGYFQKPNDAVFNVVPGKQYRHYLYKCIQSCTPNWQCTAWSSCVNGQQARTCSDSSNCGTMINKPVETQSCIVPDVCTQEAGQLCNPATKQLVSYTNGCQKSDSINQGYSTDLSACQSTCVSNQQLLTYISTWVSNQITNQQLLGYISSWVGC